MKYAYIAHMHTARESADTLTYHEQLKALFCRWIGQTGTAKQRARIAADVASLERMLTARGVRLPEGR